MLGTPTSQVENIAATFILVRFFASRAAAEPYDGVIKGGEGTFCVFAHFWRLNAYERHIKAYKSVYENVGKDIKVYESI